jgi:hypothetical protein
VFSLNGKSSMKKSTVLEASTKAVELVLAIADRVSEVKMAPKARENALALRAKQFEEEIRAEKKAKEEEALKKKRENLSEAEIEKIREKDQRRQERKAMKVKVLFTTVQRLTVQMIRS